MCGRFALAVLRYNGGVRLLLVSLLALVATSCSPKVQYGPPKLSSAGRLVRVAKGDPPMGAKELGPITAQDGDKCDTLDAVTGTYSHALIKLRNRAAARGGNYVEIMMMIEPHLETLRCYDGRFVIRGMLYDVPGATSDAEQPASDANVCDPPCSPGFKCDEGACEPVCNPECSHGQMCRPDRTCGPPS
jgi:hypothetical protein